MTVSTPPLLANLVTGSPHRNHDYDFARNTLGKALYDAGGIRTDAWPSYPSPERIEAADVLVSYASQLVVTEEQTQAIQRFLEKGGRWFAVHGSNSVAGQQHLADVIGSKFITHPTYRTFPVTITDPADPFLQGIDSFEADDEIYCIEAADDIEVLLHTVWGGQALMNMTLPEAVRPLMYRRRVGKGGILYTSLGHANRPYDKPRAESPDQPDHRGPWETPVYKEIIRRAMEWVAGRVPL